MNTDNTNKIDFNTKLLSMSVGSTIFIDDYTVIRVPSGWIFSLYASNPYSDNGPVSVSSVFVPYPNI